MSVGEIILNVIFYAFAGVAVAGALAVATSTNIVRSAFALLAVLFAAAGFYTLACADFIMAVQILVYIGGIMVLIVFAIMLTHKITDVKVSNDSAHGPVAFFAVLCMLFALVLIAVTTHWRPYDDYKDEQAKVTREDVPQKILYPKQTPLSKDLGRGMMGSFLLPFESVSVLLLAALIGATFLARKEIKEESK